jgi:antitoxin SocA-like protein
MTKYPLLCKALEHLIDGWGPVEGRTRVMKLIYLADLEWAKGHARQPYTEAKYYRWNHGPFSREVLSALDWMDGIEVVQTTLSWDGGETYCYRSGTRTRLSGVWLDPAFVEILDRVGKQWTTRPLKELLNHVYARENFLDRAFGDPLFQ